MANCCVCGNKIKFLDMCECLGDKVACEKCSSQYMVISREITSTLEIKQNAISYFEGIINHNNVDKNILNILISEIKECKFVIDEEQLEKQQILDEKERNRKKELERVNYANSFNEFYEYDVVTILNEGHGRVDKQKMMNVLSEHARNGWKLHSIYSNELGKNALRVIGLGINSTACEDVLIFERRIPEIE